MCKKTAYNIRTILKISTRFVVTVTITNINLQIECTPKSVYVP